MPSQPRTCGDVLRSIPKREAEASLAALANKQIQSHTQIDEFQTRHLRWSLRTCNTSAFTLRSLAVYISRMNARTLARRYISYL